MLVFNGHAWKASKGDIWLKRNGIMGKPQSSISHGDGCYSFVRRRLSPEKERLLADMAKKLIRIQVFKDIKPSGDCGLTDSEILDLFNKFRADNPQLDAYEFGYQCALHMTKLKASLSSEVEKA